MSVCGGVHRLVHTAIAGSRGEAAQVVFFTSQRECSKVTRNASTIVQILDSGRVTLPRRRAAARGASMKNHQSTEPSVVLEEDAAAQTTTITARYIEDGCTIEEDQDGVIEIELCSLDVVASIVEIELSISEVVNQSLSKTSSRISFGTNSSKTSNSISDPVGNHSLSKMSSQMSVSDLTTNTQTSTSKPTSGWRAKMARRVKVAASLLFATSFSMCAVTFGALATGKMGFNLIVCIIEVGIYAIVDVALLEDTAEKKLSLASTSASDDDGFWAGQLHRQLVKRKAFWLCIALLRGVILGQEYVTFSFKRAGRWQLTPLFLGTTRLIVVEIWLIAIVMMRIHRDEKQNVMRWLAPSFFSNALSWGPDCTPAPWWVTYIGSRVYLGFFTFGIYYLVKVVDRHSDRSEVQRGYSLLCGLVGFGTPYLTLKLAQADLWHSFINSVALIGFQRLCVFLVVPMAKNAFGNDDRKLWTYYIPAFTLGLEIGPCILLLGSNISNYEFWGLMFIQECNSVGWHAVMKSWMLCTCERTVVRGFSNL